MAVSLCACIAVLSAVASPAAAELPEATEVTDSSARLVAELPELPESGPRSGEKEPEELPGGRRELPPPDRPPPTWWFRYAMGPGCEVSGSLDTSREPAPSEAPGNETVSIEVTGLLPDTLYTACVVRNDGYSVLYGAEFSFVTAFVPALVQPAPAPVLSPPSSSTSASAPAVAVHDASTSRLKKALKACRKLPRRRRAACARRARRRLKTHSHSGA
jgi:hypothetical protein